MSRDFCIKKGLPHFQQQSFLILCLEDLAEEVVEQRSTD